MLDPAGNFYFDRNANALKKGQALLQSKGAPTLTSNADLNQQTGQPSGNTYNFYIGGDQANQTDQVNAFLLAFKEKMENPKLNTSVFDQIKQTMLSNMFQTPNYLGDDQGYS